jgi:hypothetical protein
LLPFGEVLVTGFRQLAEGRAVKPLSFTLPLALTIGVPVVRGNAEGSNHLAGWGIPGFRVSTQIADDNNPVHNDSSASPMVMVNFSGGSFPSNHFWTYRVPIAGGLPSASSEYLMVFFVSLSRVKVRVCFSMYVELLVMLFLVGVRMKMPLP